MRKLLFVAVLAALVAVPTSYAAQKIPLYQAWYSLDPVGPNSTFFKVGVSVHSQLGKQTRPQHMFVAFSACDGQAGSLKMVGKSRHLPFGGETLGYDKSGQLVWEIASLPAGNTKSLTIKLASPPKGGPDTCVMIKIITNATKEVTKKELHIRVL